MSDSLWPHELQHSRPPCPSPTPTVYPSSCPSSRWCHPAISSSVVPFSSCPQSLPASGSFPMSQLFAWDGQSIGVSASASDLPINTQDIAVQFSQHHLLKGLSFLHCIFLPSFVKDNVPKGMWVYLWAINYRLPMCFHSTQFQMTVHHALWQLFFMGLFCDRHSAGFCILFYFICLPRPQAPGSVPDRSWIANFDLYVTSWQNWWII